MPLPVKLYLNRAEAACSSCGTEEDVIVAILFVETQVGETEAICTSCLFRDEFACEIPMRELAAPPRSRARTLRRQKRLSAKQEREVAAELGAKVQKASGAMPGYKGDARRKGVCRIETKYTSARSFRLSLDELEKIAAECHGLERPIFVVDFRKKHTGKLDGRFAVVPMHMVEELLHASRHDC